MTRQYLVDLKSESGVVRVRFNGSPPMEGMLVLSDDQRTISALLSKDTAKKLAIAILKWSGEQ